MHIKKKFLLAMTISGLFCGAASAEVVGVTDCSLKSWDPYRGSVAVSCDLNINNNELTTPASPVANPPNVLITVISFYNNGDVSLLSRYEANSLPPLPAGTTVADLVKLGLLPPTVNVSNRTIPLTEIDDSSNSGSIRTQIRMFWGADYVESSFFTTTVNNVPLGCSLDAAGADNMQFMHGQLVRSTVGGMNIVDSTINLSCKIPTAVRISVLGREDISTSLNGVASTLSIDGTDYTKVFGTIMGNLTIPVTSTLKWSADSDVGPFNGSGIILLDIP